MDPKNMQFALQQELRAKQDAVKGRHGKEVVLESVAPAAPAPPPVPAVQVLTTQDLPPPERHLIFSPDDLEMAKNRLANPESRSRSPSPAALAGAQQDMVGDLKDVLAARKRERARVGGGHQSRKQGPSMAKLDKSLPKE